MGTDGPPRLEAANHEHSSEVALKWLAIAVGVAAVGAGILTVFSLNGDQQDAATGVDRDTASGDPPPLSTPLPLTVGEPWLLPARLNVYYVPAAYGKDATLPDLRRVYREEGGPLHEERLLRGELTKAYTLALNLHEGLIGVGVCENWERGTNCGTPSYPPMGDSRAVGFISLDGGATYAKLGALPRGAWIHAAVAGELLIGVYAEPAGADPVRFQYFPSGKAVQPPIRDAVPLVTPGEGLTWWTDDGTLYRPDGSVIRRRLVSGNNAGPPVRLSPTQWVETWWESGFTASGAQTSTFYLRVFGPAGQAQRTFSWNADIRPIVRISDHELLGNFSAADGSNDAPRLKFPAMILDLDSGTIHPLPEITAALRAAGNLGDPFVVAVEPHRD